MSVDLKVLNDHLLTRSYVEGYTPSQADVGVYTSVGSAPDASQYPHAARWYKHIASYAQEHETLPGDKEAGLKLFAAGASGAAAPAAAAADDDDIDLFGSDDEEEDPEAEAEKKRRLDEYNERKKNKAKPVAKSVVTMEVKPWEAETDMEELEKNVRSIEQDGLVWGLSKMVAIGYGVRKLQINLVIEDEKVSLDELQEKIAEFEDHVQSSDIIAMQKL